MKDFPMKKNNMLLKIKNKNVILSEYSKELWNELLKM